MGPQRPMRIAYALCLAAGIVTLLGAAFPWIQTEGGGSYGALQLGFGGLFATAATAGIVMLVFGWLRTPWAALVAFGDALLTIYVGLAIHGDMYGRAVAAGVSIAPGAPHPYGFGFAVLFAGAALAVVSAVALAIEVGPPAGLE